MSRDWPLYLDDLIESAEKIRRFLQGRTFETFSADEIFFDAVVLFNLEGIGKTVKQLPEEAKAPAPEADWSGPARMRDVLAHRYVAVDPRYVRAAASVRVPNILAHAKQLKERLGRDDGGPGAAM